MTAFHRSALLLPLVVVSLLPAPGASQDTVRVTIQGTVIDSRSGLRIPYAEVSLGEPGVSLLTDSAGTFVLRDLAVGTYHLALRKDGYATVEGPLQVLRAGGMVIRLDPLTATGDPESSRIQGVVKALDSGEPLKGALVSIQGVRGNQVTDADGRFLLTDIPAGSRRLEVSLLGYATRSDSVHVPPGSLLTLDIGLTVEPVRLPPITVSVEARNLDLELVGFYERRARERGVFFTQEAIEERNAASVVDMFEGLPGVRIVIEQGIRRAVALTGRRAMSLIYDPRTDPSTPCYPAVWLNGMPVHHGATDEPAFLDNLTTPGDVAGIEIYSSAARIPVQYNVAGACGVIVIWTRSGGERR